ncbi:hypothetical protein NQ117_09465 [Paenibacillus sp. SC116]|uniref:hypothetical protein n=1 Tax=Paenibacillus sp. SC116 TaxID=2968986 RepID=UPI00215B6722|nr:hypothetical protein [Paenibacillus sp. SC116]MCR8843915.1 hypothetical protein [Paenibacillus sp. SC116]
MKIIKTKTEPLTEEMLRDASGKLVHVPVNEMPKLGSESETENVWFAGHVCGFEKAEIYLDMTTGEKVERPEIFYSLLMTDGSTWPLSKTVLEIVEITKEELVSLSESEK